MLKCSVVQDALLESPTACDPELAAHLSACHNCAALAELWHNVDEAVLSCPTPARALQKRNEFLAGLRTTEARPLRRTARRWLQWTVAASLFFGIAGLTFILSEPRELAARPQVVEELVEWNLAVAEADSREARESLVRDRLPGLREAVRTADLQPGDRELAARLMDEGQWQATNTDPLEAAERLHGLAEEMLTLADQAELTSARSAAFVKLTAQIADRGVSKAAAKALKLTAAQEARKQARLTRLQAAQERQAARMAAVAAKQAAAEEAKQAKLQKKGKKAK